MATAKQIVVKVGSDITGFDKGIQQVNQKIDQMQKDVRTKYSAISDSMGGFGRSMTLGVTLPVVAAGAAMLNSTLNMDRLKAAMEATEGSGSKAAKTMRELQEVAKLPGLGYKEAVQAYIQLKNADMAGQDAINTLKGFGKAVAMAGGGKNELAAVIYQLQQVAGQGKVMTADLRIIKSWAPQVSKAMKEIYGTADAEALTKKGISAKQFINDISNYFNKLKGTTGGIRNDIENDLDKLDRALAKTGENAIPALQDLLKAGDGMLEAWNKVPEPVQKTTLVLGLAAAATGPVVTGIGNVVKVYGWLKASQMAIVAWQAKRVAATVAETTATVAETTATTASTAAVSASAIAKTAAVGPTLALATAENTLAASTAAAGAAATVTLGSLAALAALAGAATAGPLLAGSYILGKQAKAAQDNINKQRGREQDAFQNTYDKHSTDQLQRDLANQERIRAKAIEDRKKYEEGSWWDKWQPGNKAEHDQAMYQYKTANERVLWLKKTIAARMEEKRAQDQLSEEARKAIAENEKRNKEAIQEKFILSQSNEYERDKAQAWVDLVRTKQEIKDRAEDVKQKTGVVLNVAAQIYAAEYAYKQKIAEIAKEQAAAVQEQQKLEGLATLDLQAVNSNNEYARRRVQVQSQVLQSMQELQKLEAQGYDVSKRRALAKAQANKDLAEIAKAEKQEADSERANEMFAGAKAKAIASGNEDALATIEAYQERYNNYAQLTEIANKGYSVAGRVAEADAKYFDAIKKQKKEHEDKAKEAAKASDERIFDSKQSIIESQAQRIELSTEGGPNEKAGKLQALKLREQAELNEIARNMTTAKELPASEREIKIKALEEQKKTVELKYSKESQDIQTGGMQAIADKVRELKDREVQAWQEKIDKAKEYFDTLKQGYGITTLEGAREKALQIGLDMTAARQMPVLPQKPDVNSINSNDVKTALQEMARQAQDQVRYLAQLTDYMRELTQPV